MNFSAKTLGIAIVIALVIGFLAGFIPQHSSAVAAARDKNQAQAQLASAEQQAQLNGFKNQVAVVYVEAEKKNFAQASTDASEFFTAMQSYSEHTPDSGIRQQLSSLLSQRDAIISGLAKGDGAVTGPLQQLFINIQSVKAPGDTAP